MHLRAAEAYSMWHLPLEAEEQGVFSSCVIVYCLPVSSVYSKRVNRTPFLFESYSAVGLRLNLLHRTT